MTMRTKTFGNDSGDGTNSKKSNKEAKFGIEKKGQNGIEEGFVFNGFRCRMSRGSGRVMRFYDEGNNNPFSINC